MSDLIFKTDGEETFRIPDRTPGIKCPETKLEIKMTEPDYKQILKNQDTISQLSLEDVKNLQRILFKRECELKSKPPEKHFLDDPENIKVSTKKLVDENHIPRLEYTISVNQEAVTDHKILWKQYYIDNEYKNQDNVDKYMDNLIRGWIVKKLYKCFEGVEND